jgi:hypothetical protein
MKSLGVGRITLTITGQKVVMSGLMLMLQMSQIGANQVLTFFIIA